MAKENNQRKNKKNELAQPHDATFKKLFGEIDIAKDIIKKNLPEEVLNQLDMSTLKKLDGSFINEDLKQTFTDILYGIEIDGKDAYVSLLFEHKSYPDKQGIFQLAGYVIDAWREMIKKNKKELPVIIPIIVYHGKPSWNYKKDMRDMIPDFDLLPEYLREMLPVLKHEFIDIGEYSEEDIMEYEPLTRIVLRSFKYIYDDKDTLVEMFIISVDEIQYVVTEEVFNRVIDTLLLYYSSVNKEVSEEDIVQKIQELGGKGGKIMTILEKRHEEGIEEGKLQTVKDFIKAGAETQLIVKATKLSKEQVEEIRREIESK